MTDLKGKGRAGNADVSTARGNAEPSQGSLLSKVAASASGLAESTLRATGSPTLVGQLAASVVGSNKVQNYNTCSPSTLVESTHTSWPLNIQKQGENGASQVGPSWRSKQHAHNIENDFSSFLDHADPLSPPEDLVGEHSGTLSSLEQSWDELLSRKSSETMVLAPRTITEQEQQDGDAVVALLFGAGEEIFGPPEEEKDDYNWGLSKDQIISLRTLTKYILPPPESHRAMPADHPLNLNIDSVVEEDVGPLGRSLGAWKAQWEGVLNRYAEEVWGTLLPLVKETQLEVTNIKDSRPGPGSLVALKRLEAILGHLHS